MKKEHRWLHDVMIGYVEHVYEEYSKGGIDYKKYIVPFIENIERMLREHHRMEEERIFPDPQIKN